MEFPVGKQCTHDGDKIESAPSGDYHDTDKVAGCQLIEG